MFDKEIRITGKHADFMIKLTNNFNKVGTKLFNRNIDVYVQAPIVGFFYQRKSKKDLTTKDDTGKLRDTHILKDQILAVRDNLIFNMQLILLLDTKYECNETERINKAFRYLGKNKEDIEMFESYVLGGIEILYEKLIQNASKTDDYIDNLTSFTDDIDNYYNSKIDKEKLLQQLL